MVKPIYLLSLKASNFEGKTVREFIPLLCETEIFVCRAGNIANFFLPIDNAGVRNVSITWCLRWMFYTVQE